MGRFQNEVIKSVGNEVSKKEAILVANRASSDTVIDNEVFNDSLFIAKNNGGLRELILQKRALASEKGIGKNQYRGL